MSDFLEVLVTLLPHEAGGRRTPVSPRDGSYRPYARLHAGGPLLRLRFIEGPAVLAPGDSGWAVAELETVVDDDVITAGVELELVEHAAAAVGLVTVSRLWRNALAV